MKKLLFMLCIMLLISASCKAQKEAAKAGNDRQKQHQSDTGKKKSDGTNEQRNNGIAELKKDTARVIVDSILYGKQEIILDTTLQNAFLKKLAEKEKDKTLEWLIPFLVSAIFGVSAYIFSLITIRMDKRYRDLAFISEIDKLLAEHPELWAYEDTKKKLYKSSVEITTIPLNLTISKREKILIKQPYEIEVTAKNIPVDVFIDSIKVKTVPAGKMEKISGNTKDDEIIIENDADVIVTKSKGVELQSYEDKMLEDKIAAFCYYKLNNFELALKGRKKAQESWINYLVFIYDKSSVFRKIIAEMRGPNRPIYNKSFVKTIEKHLKDNERIQ